MPDRYTPLAAYLAALPPETTAVTLTLAEVAVIIGRPLAPAAFTARWWTITANRTTRRDWVTVGWRVTGTTMRIDRPTITFTRTASGPIAPPFARR